MTAKSDVLRRQAAQRFGGNEKQALEPPRELFEEQAKRRVVVGLLLGEVIRTNELKADEERVKGLIEEMASAYEDPSEVVEFYSKNKELMDNMRNVALEEQAVEAVLSKAKVSEKSHFLQRTDEPAGVISPRLFKVRAKTRCRKAAGFFKIMIASGTVLKRIYHDSVTAKSLLCLKYGNTIPITGEATASAIARVLKRR